MSGNIRIGRSALGAFLLVVACGGTIAPQYGIEAACARLHATYSRNVVRCIGRFADLPPEADFVASCVGLATAKGSLLQPADLDACTDSIHGCPSGPPACLGSGSALLFPAHEKRGSLPEGATCLTGLQCASGVCNNVSYTASCGVCVVPKVHGAACNDAAHDVCEDPTFCYGKRCRYSGGEAGESCTTYGSGSCAEPFYCSANHPGDGSNLDGHCRPRGSAGAACTDSVPCLEALACIAGTCRAPLPEGAPCDAARDWCAMEDRHGTCVGGICVFPRTGVQEGGGCDPDACRADLTCQSHVCTSLAGVGAPCDDWTPCVSDASCGAERRCILRPGPGAPCRPSSPCAAGATCVSFHAGSGNDLGTCHARGGVGAPCPCSDVLTCIEGKCVAWSDAICR